MFTKITKTVAWWLIPFSLLTLCYATLPPIYIYLIACGVIGWVVGGPIFKVWNDE